MEDAECVELLRHLQRQMAELGLADLADRIASDIDIEPTDAPARLLRYLDALRTETQLRSNATTQAIVGRLRDAVRTESGEPVRAVRVEMTDADADLYGVRSFDLGAGPALDSVIEELESLREDVLRSLVERGWG